MAGDTPRDIQEKETQLHISSPLAGPESIWVKDKLFTKWEFLLLILRVKLKNATNRTKVSTCWPKGSLHTLHQVQSERKTGINKVTALRPSWAVSCENTTKFSHRTSCLILGQTESITPASPSHSTRHHLNINSLCLR